MYETIASISDIGLFDIASEVTHQYSFGSNQGWYSTQWQKNSGCGPSTAANMFYYIGSVNPEAGKKISSDFLSKTKECMLKLMNELWEFVTPTKMGVNSTELFMNGSKQYALSKGLGLNCKFIDIPNVAFKNKVRFEDFISTIEEGLKEGYPLAFLNLSNGKLENLHHWHWVTLMTLEKDELGNYFCLASDEGEKKRFNMKLWFETTNLGGGIVSFSM